MADSSDFETLREELEILREIYLAEQQLAAGQGVPHEEAREQILSDLDQRETFGVDYFS